MSGILGNRKQENKINEMGDITVQMFPALDPLAVKGTFRNGVQVALAHMKYGAWDELADQSTEERKRFFQQVLAGSVERLKMMGLKDGDLKRLFHRLMSENEKYVSH